MSRASTLILIGILVILTPFSGFPVSFRTFLAVILGACVSGIGFAMRAQAAQDMRSRAGASSPPTAPSMPESQPANIDSETPPQKPHGVSPI
ncbi:MAG: hypothetical protein ACYC6X_02570 [Minisyncoccota bacterium]